MAWLKDYWFAVLLVETAVLVWLVWRPPFPPKFLLTRNAPYANTIAGRPSKIWYFRMGRLAEGTTIRVSLQAGSVAEANVRLVDSWNFRRLRKMKRHGYIGGLITRSTPVDLPVPRHGKWYVVLDTGGLSGKVVSSVRVFSGRVPTALPAESPLAEIRRNIRELPTNSTDDTPGKPKVFISYASEDGESVAHPLAEALKLLDVSIWIDKQELHIGDELVRSISDGIATSRFGVVVLSPNFFAKNWPLKELSGLFAGQMAGKQVILPIWHEITKGEILRRAPMLSETIARSTGQYTIAEIAAEIADVVINDENSHTQDTWDEDSGEAREGDAG